MTLVGKAQKFRFHIPHLRYTWFDFAVAVVVVVTCDQNSKFRHDINCRHLKIEILGHSNRLPFPLLLSCPFLCSQATVIRK